MENKKFNPINGYEDETTFPNPTDGTGQEARKQLNNLPFQLLGFINELISTNNGINGAAEIGISSSDVNFNSLTNVKQFIDKIIVLLNQYKNEININKNTADAHISNNVIHVTNENKMLWNDKYTRAETVNLINNKVVELGRGDMAKAIYDSNSNGIVDNAEKVNNHTVDRNVLIDEYSNNEIDGMLRDLTNGKKIRVVTSNEYNSLSQIDPNVIYFIIGN